MPTFVRADGRIDIKSLTLAEIEQALTGCGSAGCLASMR